MENTVKKLIDQAAKWIGYLEKKSNAYLDGFTVNAGSSNYTCFARDYYKHTGGNYQGQPWCAMFVSEVFVQTLAWMQPRHCQDTAKTLPRHCYAAACTIIARPEVAQFKESGCFSHTPEPGAMIFFTNGKRAYHTGIVTEVTSTRVKTIEENTSGASGVIENGGGVCRKSYSRNESRILGYGLPPWSKLGKSGWQQEDGGWRFYLDPGKCVVNDWYEYEGHWYWFDGAGIMVKNVWYQYNGHWYYLGADGAMVKGQQTLDGKWYIMDDEGRMMTNPVTLTPDADGALRWPGLVE